MRRLWSRTGGRLLVVALFVILAVLPELQVSIPGVLPGPTYSAGTQQLLALCFLTGALALTYQLLFGSAGLLSFGHALYFATGVYVFAIGLEKWHLSLGLAAVLAIAVGTLLAAAVGAVSLRVDGISFAMVTLAFAQAGSVLVFRNPNGLTGGEEGLGLAEAKLPNSLVGVVNTENLYWVALATLAVVAVAIGWVGRTHVGRLMPAARDNVERVRVLGIRPYWVQLIAFVVAGGLAAAVGIGYVLVQDGANPTVTTPDFTLSLLVMVVLGGVGARWGAVLGGVVYTLLDQRLTVLSSSDTITSLPKWLQVPLSEPLFVLGVLFIAVVLFLPGGLAGVVERLRRIPSRRGDGGTSTGEITPTTPSEAMATTAPETT